MKTMPNQGRIPQRSISKNDLYNKFCNIFTMITSKEFDLLGRYHFEAYVPVSPVIEEDIQFKIDSISDEIVPIIGSTGIGKTYLLLHTLEKKYQVNHVTMNNPMLVSQDGFRDVIYYSSFEYEATYNHLSTAEIILSKTEALRCFINNVNGGDAISDEEINRIISKERLEILTYEGLPSRIAISKMKLLHALKHCKIRNIVFICDDLESLDEIKQHEICRDFLSLFEELKNIEGRGFYSKLILCLRTTTYANVYKKDYYNTHRASQALELQEVPSLSDVFSKRFELIKDNETLYNQAGNHESWLKAEEILIKLAIQIDVMHRNILTMLNNHNIGNALNDFDRILTNRMWTQSNAAPLASFEIKGYNFRLSEARTMRVLAMNETDIYFQNPTYSLRCILPRPGAKIQVDYIALIILRFYRNKIDMKNSTNSLAIDERKKSQVLTILLYCLNKKGALDRYDATLIRQYVSDIFEYYTENGMLLYHEQLEQTSDCPIYLSPRARVIFDLFFKNTILFDIFRDGFLLSSNYDQRCTADLTQDQRFADFIKYTLDIITYEHTFIQQIITDGDVDRFRTEFGSGVISQLFVNAIEASFEKFFSSKVPKDLLVPYEYIAEQSKRNANSLLDAVDLSAFTLT